MLDTVEKLCKIFFEKLGVDFSAMKVQEEAENIYKISLKSEDSHLLIGPHGKNLETLTHLLKLLIAKKSDTYIKIHLEVNDYMQQKNQKLLNFITSKMQLVEQTGNEVILPYFTSYERKKVHSYVSEKGGNVFTQSIGEGNERRIHLCKKDKKITIDIDGSDI